MSRFSRIFACVMTVLSAVCLLVMTGVMCWQVISRYLLDSSPSWAEQLCLLLLIWFVLLAAAVGVRESTHIEVTFVRDGLSPSVALSLQIFGQLMIVMFGLSLIAGGWVLLNVTSQHVIPGLGISRSLAYWPLLASGTAMIFFAVEQLLAIRNRYRIDHTWN